MRSETWEAARMERGGGSGKWMATTFQCVACGGNYSCGFCIFEVPLGLGDGERREHWEEGGIITFNLLCSPLVRRNVVNNANICRGGRVGEGSCQNIKISF